MTTADQTVAAMAVGLASAAGFATANALQHRAAGTVPETVRRALAVLAHLARQRIWLVATGVSFCAMLLHALALRLGSLALVQPLMLLGVVLAVPLRAALGRTRPTSSELTAVSVTVAGLGVFVVCTDPAPSMSTPHPAVLIAFVAGCLGLAWLVFRASGRTATRKLQAAWLGVAAGVMFGVTAGLLKIVGGALTSRDLIASAATLAGLTGAGLIGVALNQRAYQIAPLAFSMPLVNVVDVVVAVLFGALVFDEQPAHSLTLLLLQAVGLCVTGVGLRGIAALEASSLPTARLTAQEATS